MENRRAAICFYEEKGMIGRIKCRLLQTEALLESVNTSTCINQLLLARKERMTFGTNFNTDVLFGGTCVNDIAASACNGCILVCGMHLLLHGCHLFQKSRTAAGRLPRNRLTKLSYHTAAQKSRVFEKIFFSWADLGDDGNHPGAVRCFRRYSP